MQREDFPLHREMFIRSPVVVNTREESGKKMKRKFESEVEVKLLEQCSTGGENRHVIHNIRATSSGKCENFSLWRKSSSMTRDK